MRLSLVASTLVGALAIGWATTAPAQPGPPLSPPIFYCPAPPGPAAAAPQAPPATDAAHWRRRTACPSRREVAGARHHWRRHRRYATAAPRARAGPPEVSESQAFIYRYERAMHGLNAGAAEQAWGHAPPPRQAWAGPACPPQRAGHCPWGPPPPASMPRPMAMAPPMGPPMGPHCPPQVERCPWARPTPWPPRFEGNRPGRGLFAAGDRRWRHGGYGAVYRVAGRDAFGYLVWPGKTPPGDIAP